MLATVVCVAGVAAAGLWQGWLRAALLFVNMSDVALPPEVALSQMLLNIISSWAKGKKGGLMRTRYIFKYIAFCLPYMLAL